MQIVNTNYSNYLNQSFLTETALLSHLKAVELFAGAGGLSLGFKQLGLKLHAYESNKDACITHINNVSPCTLMSLTTDYQFDDQDIDILLGGVPCQPFSLAGKHKGEKDKRNGFDIFVSALTQLQPKFFLIENVKGLLLKHKDYLDTILYKIKQLGYDVEYHVLNTKHFLVPQSRERLIIVGYLQKTDVSFFDCLMQFSCADIVTVKEAFDDLIPDTESFEYLTENMLTYIQNYEQKSKCRVSRDLHLEKPSRTVTCRNLYGKTSDMLRVVDKKGKRLLTIAEAKRLQSFPDWFEFSGSKSAQYTQIGNAVPPLFSLALANAVALFLK